MLKLIDLDKAKEFDDSYFKKNEIDELLVENWDLSQIKKYPGSPKGPNPEDDPKFYSQWFIENQPK